MDLDKFISILEEFRREKGGNSRVFILDLDTNHSLIPGVYWAKSLWDESIEGVCIAGSYADGGSYD